MAAWDKAAADPLADIARELADNRSAQPGVPQVPVEAPVPSGER
jgi:hypothetical protein